MPSIRSIATTALLCLVAIPGFGQAEAAAPGAIVNERLAAWNLCAAVPVCISAAPTKKHCIISSPR